MRQKNKRRSLLTLYHHHGHDKRISSENHNHHDNHLLHSDKSTYTALRFGPLSGRKLSNLQNFLRKFLLLVSFKKESKLSFCSLSSAVQRPVLFSPEKRGFLEKMKSYAHLSKANNTYFYRLKRLVNKFRLGPQNLAHTSIPLLVSGFGLLMLLSLSIGCVGGASGVDAYAEGENEAVAQSDNSSVSLSLADTANSGNMTIIGDNKSIQEQVDTTNNTGYIAVDFHVTATNIDKYDVYVQSSNSALIGETNGGKVESISNNTAYSDMVNHAGWGYAVAEGANVNAETLTYKPIQTSASSAVDSGSATNTTVNKDYTLAFAANLTGATADHYKSNITLSVAAGAGEVTNLYSVTYNTNGSTGGTVPTMQTAESDNTTYTFTAPTSAQYGLVKTGYALGGWSENPNTNIPDYLPGETITLTQTNSSKTLYAIWLNWSNIATMQSMSPEICASANINDSKTLADSRDGTSYTIKKLSDGKCWMTQNLRIVNKAITSADSDVTSNYTIPASSNPWSDTAPTTNKVHYANNTTYGAYYSWYTATAGTSTSVSADGQNASSSICPKGWRLPTSRAGGEFEALVNKGKSSWDNTNKGYWLGGTSSTASGAAFFPAGGYVNNGSLNTAGSNGYYWSSTAQSASNAYSLYFNSSNVVPSNSNNRFSGFSVRCVAR